jgi:hypothetical protein
LGLRGGRQSEPKTRSDKQPQCPPQSRYHSDYRSRAS